MTLLLKLPLTKLIIKVHKSDIDLWSYNLPERDEFVTKVIRVMIKFNKGVVMWPIEFLQLYGKRDFFELCHASHCYNDFYHGERFISQHRKLY
jgi:hypothetical protein